MAFKLKAKIEKKALLKFLLLLAVLVVYFGYLSWKYGLATGGLVAGLTWSFFVLCTPIADAGFLLDFPVRLIIGLRMIHSEIMVWVIAIGLNFWAVIYSPASYQDELLTDMLYQILTTPWPYWSIPVLCAMGTFLSIHFGDGVMDAVENHKNGHQQKRDEQRKKHKKLRLMLTAVLVVVVIVVYYDLIASLGLNIPE